MSVNTETIFYFLNVKTELYKDCLLQMKHFNSPTVDAVLSDVVLLVVLSGLTEILEVPHIRKLFSPQTNKVAFSISAVSRNNCLCLAFIQLQPKGTNRATFRKDLSDLI